MHLSSWSEILAAHFFAEDCSCLFFTFLFFALLSTNLLLFLSSLSMSSALLYTSMHVKSAPSFGECCWHRAKAAHGRWRFVLVCFSPRPRLSAAAIQYLIGSVFTNAPGPQLFQISWVCLCVASSLCIPIPILTHTYYAIKSCMSEYIVCQHGPTDFVRVSGCPTDEWSSVWGLSRRHFDSEPFMNLFCQSAFLKVLLSGMTRIS